MTHNFRHDCEQFRAAIGDTMPDVLTVEKIALKPADEVKALIDNIAALTCQLLSTAKSPRNGNPRNEK